MTDNLPSDRCSDLFSALLAYNRAVTASAGDPDDIQASLDRAVTFGVLIATVYHHDDENKVPLAQYVANLVRGRFPND